MIGQTAVSRQPTVSSPVEPGIAVGFMHRDGRDLRRRAASTIVEGCRATAAWKHNDMARPMMVDEIDLSILALLQEDARMSNAEIARRVGLAASAIFQRIRKLEESGHICGYTARLDPKKLGYGLTAFVRIQTGTGAQAPQVTRDLAAIPEVTEIHRVVGEDCFFLKVRVADTAALEDLLDHRIQPLESVASTKTTIVLSTGKETLAVPIPPARTDGRAEAADTVSLEERRALRSAR
jgi:Lrp/AsnC family leucine-responsive transcriptional regulator